MAEHERISLLRCLRQVNTQHTWSCVEQDKQCNFQGHKLLT